MAGRDLNTTPLRFLAWQDVPCDGRKVGFLVASVAGKGGLFFGEQVGRYGLPTVEYGAVARERGHRPR